MAGGGVSYRTSNAGRLASNSNSSAPQRRVRESSCRGHPKQRAALAAHPKRGPVCLLFHRTQYANCPGRSPSLVAQGVNGIQMAAFTEGSRPNRMPMAMENTTAKR